MWYLEQIEEASPEKVSITYSAQWEHRGVCIRVALSMFHGSFVLGSNEGPEKETARLHASLLSLDGRKSTQNAGGSVRVHLRHLSHVQVGL